MLSKLIFILSMVVTFLFFIYGYNCFFLLKTSKHYIKPTVKTDDSLKPSVAIHLPIYNEKYVVRRLIDSCAAMAAHYGKDKVRIFLLDDSDDETSLEVEALATNYQMLGYKIELLHRDKREGYKAGALQEALMRTEEEFIAVFDADFVPPPDFLEKVIPHFLTDPKVGLVQCRWSHLNRDYNLITKAVSIGMDSHFFIEQPGRFSAGCFLNFNGSAGVIRRKALLEAGGWQMDTLAEDLDASYRIQMKGYKVVYLKEPNVPGEVTPSLTSFKRQQSRWACGSIQTARKLLPSILLDPRLMLKQKIEAYIHLTYYTVHPLMFAAFLLASTAALSNITTISIPRLDSHIITRTDVGGMVLSVDYGGLAIVLLGSTILLCTIATWVYYLAAVKAQSLSISKLAPYLFFLGLIGYGISISNTVEVLKGLIKKEGLAFKRTPKYSIESKEDEWRQKKYQVPLDKKLLIELFAIILGVIASLVAINTSNWGILPILVWYTIAYSFVFGLSVFHSGKEV